MSRWAVFAASCLFGLSPLTPAVAQDSSAVLEVVVTAAEGAVTLQNTRLTLEPAGREGLASAEGRLVFVDLAAGTYTLRAQRIGYVPAEFRVALQAGERRSLAVTLTHVVVQLTGVRVVTFPPCKAPGVPAPATNATLASLLDQLRLNGEQYRYLIDSAPFSYIAERTSGMRRRNGDSTVQAIDTIVVSSNRDGWRYRAGRVVSIVRGTLGRRELAMNLPALDDFASRDFLRNHCFYYGGVEREDTVPMLRIDFRAADHLKDPDVHGTIWLDSATFTIRRADLELSRLPRELRGAEAVTARTTFVEWMKAVPIIDRVDGETVLQPVGSGQTVAANTESHRLLQVVEHERTSGRKRH